MSDRRFAGGLRAASRRAPTERRWRVGITIGGVAAVVILFTQLPASADASGQPPLASAKVSVDGAPRSPGAGRGPRSTTTTTTTSSTTTTTAPPATTTTTLPRTSTTRSTAPRTSVGTRSSSVGQAPITTTTLPPTAKAAPVTTTTTTTTTTVPRPNQPSLSSGRCQPDPAPVIEALPPGGVFRGSGCYDTYGIEITKPVTIDGGTYDDPLTVNDTDKRSIPPIIRVKNTSDVTIENAVLNGENGLGGFHRGLVGEAGLDILSSDHVSILDVATHNTFGDGMTLFSQFGVDKNPVTNLYVNGLTISGAGRQGITVGYVKDSTLDNVDLVSSAEEGWDFESDLAHIGSGDVTINDAVSMKGIRLVEALEGPIVFNDCQCSRHLHLLNDAAASGQLVTFNGGTYAMSRDSDTGCNAGGIVVAGPGRMVFNHMTVTRQPGVYPPKGPAMSVTDGGMLTLIDTPLPAPVGGAGPGSAVNVEP